MSYQDGGEAIEKPTGAASDDYEGYNSGAPINTASPAGHSAVPDVYTGYPHHVNLSPSTYKNYILDAPTPGEIQWRILAEDGFDWFKKWGLGWWGFTLLYAAVIIALDSIINAIIISSLGQGDIPLGQQRFKIANQYYSIFDAGFYQYFWVKFFQGLPFVFLHSPMVVSALHAVMKRCLYDYYPGQTSFGLAKSTPLSVVEGAIPHWKDWFYGFSHMYLECIKLGIPMGICIGIGNSLYFVPGTYVSFISGFSFFLLFQWGTTGSGRFATTSPALSYVEIVKIAFRKVNQNIILIIYMLLFSIFLLILGIITIIGWIAALPAISFVSIHVSRSIFGWRQEFAIRSPQEETEDVEVVGSEHVY